MKLVTVDGASQNTPLQSTSTLWLTNEAEIDTLQIQVRMERSWLEKTSIPDRGQSIESLLEICLQENGSYPSLNSWDMHVYGHELMLRSPT